MTIDNGKLFDPITTIPGQMALDIDKLTEAVRPKGASDAGDGGECRECGATIEKGSEALYYKRAKELACITC